MNKGKTRFLENLPGWKEFGNRKLREANVDAKVIAVRVVLAIVCTNVYFVGSFVCTAGSFKVQYM